jgi:hypothetical protein
MVFGLMAFGSTVAQAEVGAKWLFAEKAPNSGLVPFLLASVGLEAETLGVLHTKIAGISVLFLCPVIEGLNIKLTTNGSIEEGMLIDFLNCTTDLNGVGSKACEPAGGGKAGVITTKELHGLIVLHELKPSGIKDDVLLILPDPVGGVKSEIFATVEMGAECSIGTKVNIIGHLTLKDCQEMFLTHLVKHLLEIGPLTELWAISKTAEHVATILGSFWAFLIGAHEGLKFSGDPI